jgi:hypothetical protein
VVVPCCTHQGVGGLHARTPPTIQALGVTQEWSGTSWKATGYVAGIGRLEAWGPSLPTALEVLQALAARRVAEAAEGQEEEDQS